MLYCLTIIGCEHKEAKSEAKVKPTTEKLQKKDKIKKSAQIIPDNAMLLYKLKSLETLYHYLSVTDNTVFGEQLSPKETIEGKTMEKLKI